MTWKTVPLSAVVQIRRGYDLPARIRRPGAVPVVSSGGVSGYHDQAMAEGPGVVIGRATNLGQPTWIDGPYWPHNTTLYVEDFCGNDPRWIFRWFQANDLSGYNSGSVQPMLNRNYIAKVPVSLPPPEEQGRIADVLGGFDDLIDANHGTVAALEQLVQGLFERGQFDRPLNGEPSTTVGSLVEVNPPVAKPRGEAAYVEMAMLPTNGALLPPPGRRPAQGGARFSNGDALLARITPCLENGKTAYVTNLRAGEVGVGSTEFIVLRGQHRTKGVWAYCLARSARFRAFAIQQLGDGTSGRQRLSADAVANYRLAVPDDVELARFHAAAEPLVEGMVDLHEEALELTRQRDELLPLLMSGKVRVSEVEGVA